LYCRPYCDVIHFDNEKLNAASKFNAFFTAVATDNELNRLFSFILATQKNCGSMTFQF